MLLLVFSVPAKAQETTTNNLGPDSTATPQQTTVAPEDSVRMIVIPETGKIAFVIPQSVAYHYRSLVMDMVPALEEQIQLLEDATAQQLVLSDNRLQQINQLEQIRNNLNEQLHIFKLDSESLEQQLQAVNASRKREIWKKKFWRGSNFLFMGTTAILATVLIAR